MKEIINYSTIYNNKFIINIKSKKHMEMIQKQGWPKLVYYRRLLKVHGQIRLV